MNGRTVFNWRGPWDGMQAYEAGDAVSFQSSSFIALDDISPPMRGDPGNPPPNNNTVWNVLCRGIRWKAGWQKQSTYKALDVVAYQGSSYIAVQDVPEDIEIINQAFWNVIASIGQVGLNWRGDWSDKVEYSKDDAVRFNANSYIAINESPAGTKPTDDDYWQPMSDELDKAAVDTASLIISSIAALGAVGSAIASLLGLAAVTTTAEGAATTATAAAATATAAEATATAAEATATAAEATANTAQEEASVAQETASAAQEAASAAQEEASAVQETANTAQEEASAAQEAASVAQATANTAQDTASAAQDAATEIREGVSGLSETIRLLDQKISNLETVVGILFER